MRGLRSNRNRICSSIFSQHSMQTNLDKSVLDYQQSGADLAERQSVQPKKFECLKIQDAEEAEVSYTDFDLKINQSHQFDIFYCKVKQNIKDLKQQDHRANTLQQYVKQHDSKIQRLAALISKCQ